MQRAAHWGFWEEQEVPLSHHGSNQQGDVPPDPPFSVYVSFTPALYASPLRYYAN